MDLVLGSLKLNGASTVCTSGILHWRNQTLVETGTATTIHDIEAKAVGWTKTLFPKLVFTLYFGALEISDKIHRHIFQNIGSKVGCYGEILR